MAPLRCASSRSHLQSGARQPGVRTDAMVRDNQRCYKASQWRFTPERDLNRFVKGTKFQATKDPRSLNPTSRAKLLQDKRQLRYIYKLTPATPRSTDKATWPNTSPQTPTNSRHSDKNYTSTGEMEKPAMSPVLRLAVVFVYMALLGTTVGMVLREYDAPVWARAKLQAAIPRRVGVIDPAKLEHWIVTVFTDQ